MSLFPYQTNAQQTSLCCTCISGQTNFCLQNIASESITNCDDVAGSSFLRSVTDPTGLTAAITCTGSPLNASQCQSGASLQAVCPSTPKTISELPGFLGNRVGAPAAPDDGPRNLPPPDEIAPPEDVIGSQTIRSQTIPQLGVSIPGLQFGNVTVDDRYIYVPFLAQYIAALYRYVVGISVLVATIMVVYGGFLYLAGGVSGDTGRGKSMIQDAVIGMLLVFSAYALLYTINPETLNLNALRLLNLNQPQSRDTAPTAITQITPTPSSLPIGSSAIAPPSTISQQSGDISLVRFNYHPNQYWRPNNGWILFPSRLTNQSTPVHVYVYLHGYAAPDFSEDIYYLRLLKSSLRKVAGNMNIVIVGPHWGASDSPRFMYGFTAANFISALQQGMSNNSALQGLTIQDVVYSGHSAATCRPGYVLADAALHPVAGQIGIVAYDGCVGGNTTRTIHDRYGTQGTLLMNMDGMGYNPEYGENNLSPYQVARQIWSLRRVDCPAYIPPSIIRADDTLESRRRPVFGCEVNQSGNVWMFKSRYGHGASVSHMTDWAFQHFYNH